jgi:hypothetical protein
VAPRNSHAWRRMPHHPHWKLAISRKMRKKEKTKKIIFLIYFQKRREYPGEIVTLKLW